MLLTPIEHMLFQGQNLVHEVIEFTIEKETLLLTVQPQSRLQPFPVQFHQVEHVSEEVFEEDTRLPWHILGCDAHALGPDQWAFILHCVEKEVVWNASWPTSLS